MIDKNENQREAAEEVDPRVASLCEWRRVERPVASRHVSDNASLPHMPIGCSRLSPRFVFFFEWTAELRSGQQRRMILRSPADLKPGATFMFPDAAAAHTGVKPTPAAHTRVRLMAPLLAEIQDAALQSPRSPGGI